MKNIITGLLGVLSLFVIGSSASAVLLEDYTEGVCADSGDGINTYVFGTVKGYTTTEKTEVSIEEDACVTEHGERDEMSSGSYLHEVSCSDEEEGVIAHSWVECEYGCEYGKCLYNETDEERAVDDYKVRVMDYSEDSGSVYYPNAYVNVYELTPIGEEGSLYHHHGVLKETLKTDSYGEDPAAEYSFGYEDIYIFLGFLDEENAKAATEWDFTGYHVPEKNFGDKNLICYTELENTDKRSLHSTGFPICSSQIGVFPEDKDKSGTGADTDTDSAYLPTCSDSDGGKDVYQKGILNVYTPTYGNRVVHEYCTDIDGNNLDKGDYVEELVCLKNDPEYAYEHSRTECPGGCEDGVCIPLVFSDVTTRTEYKESIEWMHENRVIQGRDDGNFVPDECANRAEFLRILFEILDVDLSATAQAELFSDTPADAWYASYVRAARARGTVSGYGDGTFSPGQCVNRAEAIKMAVLEFNNGQIPTYRRDYGEVEDVENSAWFYNYIDYALSANVLGREHVVEEESDEFSYRPGESMSRKEVSEMLYRMKAVSDTDYETYEDDGIVSDVPTIINPEINSVLTNYPRVATLEWTEVEGAASYEIELVCDYCNGVEKWSMPYIYESETNSYTTDQLSGDNEYRFRVRIVDESGEKELWSRYNYFTFDTSSFSGTTSWQWKMATTPEDAIDFINGEGAYSEPCSVGSIAGTYYGFYIFYLSDEEGSSNWEWKFVDSPHDGYDFLNAMDGYEGTPKDRVEFAYKYLDEGLYIFYEDDSSTATWGWETLSSVSDAQDFLNGQGDYSGAKVAKVAKFVTDELIMFYRGDQVGKAGWKLHSAESIDDTNNFLNGFDPYDAPVSEADVFSEGDGFIVFYK